MRVIESEHSVSYIFNGFYSSIRPGLKHPLMFAKRRSNYYLTNFQCRTRAIRVLGYPFYLIVEPGNVCTLCCPLCPTGQRDTARPKGLLRFADFQNIVDEIGDFLVTINFTNWGEPFLNKEILSMVRYCKEKGIPFTRLDSNLNTFDPNDCESLVLSGLDRLSASIDGASQETYEKYRKGGDFHRVIFNLKAIASKRKELGRQKPYLRWQFLVFRHNQHEIARAVKIAKEIGVDRIDFSGGRVNTGTEVLKPLAENIEVSKGYLVDPGTKFSLYTKDKKPKKLKRVCDWLWKRSVINWDGSVSPCCAVWPQKYDFGNCFQRSFKEIWNNQKFTEARTVVRESLTRQVSIEEHENPVCAICAHYQNYI